MIDIMNEALNHSPAQDPPTYNPNPNTSYLMPVPTHALPHALPLSPTPITSIDATPYIQALLDAQGNIALAAERLQLTTGQYTTQIAQDPDALQKLNDAMRVFTTMQLFESVAQAKIVLDTALPSLTPRDASRNFTNIATIIEQMTRKTNDTTNVNVYDIAMRRLPPHVRDALRVLQDEAPPAQEMTINHTDIDDD